MVQVGGGMMLGQIVYVFVGLWMLLGMAWASFSKYRDVNNGECGDADMIGLCTLICFTLWTGWAIVRGL